MSCAQTTVCESVDRQQLQFQFQRISGRGNNANTDPDKNLWTIGTGIICVRNGTWDELRSLTASVLNFALERVWSQGKNESCFQNIRRKLKNYEWRGVAFSFQVEDIWEFSSQAKCTGCSNLIFAEHTHPCAVRLQGKWRPYRRCSETTWGLITFWPCTFSLYRILRPLNKRLWTVVMPGFIFRGSRAHWSPVLHLLAPGTPEPSPGYFSASHSGG